VSELPDARLSLRRLHINPCRPYQPMTKSCPADRPFVSRGKVARDDGQNDGDCWNRVLGMTSEATSRQYIPTLPFGITANIYPRKPGATDPGSSSISF